MTEHVLTIRVEVRNRFVEYWSREIIEGTVLNYLNGFPAFIAKIADNEDESKIE